MVGFFQALNNFRGEKLHEVFNIRGKNLHIVFNIRGEKLHEILNIRGENLHNELILKKIYVNIIKGDEYVKKKN